MNYYPPGHKNYNFNPSIHSLPPLSEIVFGSANRDFSLEYPFPLHEHDYHREGFLKIKSYLLNFQILTKFESQ